jgi:hypothetical protein
MTAEVIDLSAAREQRRAEQFPVGTAVAIDLSAPCSEAGHVWANDGAPAGTCLLCGEPRPPSA